MTKHNDQLLPCPFCGCQVTLLTGQENHRIAGHHSRSCAFLDVDVIVDGRDAWNSRAQLPTAGGAVPEGYVLVPKYPTPEMHYAGRMACGNGDLGHHVYATMIAAAHRAQAQGGDV